MNETKGPLQQHLHLHLNASATPTYAEVRTTIMEHYRTTNGVLKTSTTVVFSSQQQPWRRPSSNGHWSNIQRQRKRKRKEQRQRIQQRRSQRKRIPTRKRLRRLRQLQQRRGKRKATAMLSAKWSRERKQRKAERNSQQGERKESNSNMLQMWPTGPLGKGLPNSGVQHGRDTAGTEPGWNIPMVWPTQWVWQLLVQQQPVKQLQDSTSPTTTTTTTASFASTINKHSYNNSPTCGSTGPSGSGYPQWSKHNSSSSATAERRPWSGHHGRQWCSNACVSTRVCTRHTTVSIATWTGPRLRTATDEVIYVHGYRWVYMHNTSRQTLVVPFYVCDVTQPIMSVTRLAEQGFTTQLNETPTITHTPRDSTQHWSNEKASTSCLLYW